MFDHPFSKVDKDGNHGIVEVTYCPQIDAGAT